jgi:hypothetical protein
VVLSGGREYSESVTMQSSFSTPDFAWNTHETARFSSSTKKTRLTIRGNSFFARCSPCKQRHFTYFCNLPRDVKQQTPSAILLDMSRHARRRSPICRSGAPLRHRSAASISSLSSQESGITNQDLRRTSTGSTKSGKSLEALFHHAPRAASPFLLLATCSMQAGPDKMSGTTTRLE